MSSMVLGTGLFKSIARMINVSMVRTYKLQRKLQAEVYKVGKSMSVSSTEYRSKSYEQEMFQQKALITAQRLEQLRAAAVQLERKSLSKRYTQVAQEPAAKSSTPAVALGTAIIEKKVFKKRQPAMRMSVPELPDMNVEDTAAPTSTRRKSK